MSPEYDELDTKALTWLVRVVNNINDAGPVLDVDYGYWALGEIPVLFDAEETRFSLAPSEFKDEIVIRYKLGE